jgi:hypothetical protein
MEKIALNTFTGGMNCDLATGLIQSDKYRDAQNFRIITTEGSTTGSLENIKGTKSIIDDAAVQDLVDGMIIGSCQLRDSIILFTTENEGDVPTARGNRIYKLQVNLNTETQTLLDLLYDDSLNVDDSSLCFSTYYPIKAIGKYETPNVQKVYWTDGYNNLRYLNVANYLTVDGTVYAVDGDYMSVDKFEFLPKFIATKPVLKDIVGGNISTGMIAYAYQLYMINGAETAFSPLSDPIHVVSDNDFMVSTITYKGDGVTINSGKGFTLEINNTGNNGYNRLRLIRVQYSYLNSVPEVFIANEIEIPTTGSIIQITDVGEIRGELTVDEFNISSTELFKCQDIGTKDNRLFTANIVKSEFSVDDFDTRAVRFNAAPTKEAWVYDTTLGSTQVALTTWTVDYPTDHDGVNVFNDSIYDGESSYMYKYQSNGITVGAEGLNVLIDFETELVELDSSNNDATFHTYPPTDSDDLSYKNYASPWKDGKLSWQRDEVYRLFVVFGNDRGQIADPKWICDLKMPSLHDEEFTNSSSETVYSDILAVEDTGIIQTYRLYPRINFKNLPTGASYAQVYRVKRERADRSVVTQGFAIPSQKPTSFYCPDEAYKVIPTITGLTGKIKLVSPEINITKNISKQANDYIEYITNYNNSDTTDVHYGANVAIGNIHKMKGNERVPFTHFTWANINDAFQVSPLANPNIGATAIDGDVYTNYDYDGDILAKGCTGLIISYAPDEANWSAEGVANVIVNYRSRVYDSQYGGYTHEARMSNICIPCSDIITTEDTWYDISYGDTFINYFDVSTLLMDLAQSSIIETWSETVLVPLESSINCDLRYDTEAAHFYPIPINYDEYNPYMRQEYSGSHTMQVHGSGDDHTFNQTQNLYLYNTVYSQQIDIQAAVSLIIDKTLETEFDCMVKVSDLKSNGEITDSWTKFGVNSFIEVDSIYGPLNALNTFNDKMFYFQDKGFGVLSINQKSLITDSNSEQLVLGTGGALDDYEYISTIIGCKDKFAVVGGSSGLFWYDRVNNYIIKHSDRIDKVSVSKGIQSYLTENILPNQRVIAHADINNTEILFTFNLTDASTIVDTPFTLAYSENTDAFISFYSFIPSIYIPYDNRYLTTTRSKYCSDNTDLQHLFLHDSDIYPRCNFYALEDEDDDFYFDSTLKILYNQDYNEIKVWDNLFITSNVYVDGVDVYNQSINSIRCYNDYQNTDFVDLVYRTNLERRDRKWSTVVPRNMVDVVLTDDPDVLSPWNLEDTDRTFRERLKDKYMILDVEYNNTNDKDKIVLNSIASKYRINFR